MTKTITFLSDFGPEDWFVAAVKGEILKIAPDVRIIDITHHITSHDVRAAAFVLSAVYNNFPTGTIHLCVVDPGVGSARKPLVACSQEHYFVGPDNGLFSFIYDERSQVYEISVQQNTSSTFHARDVFGPAAAKLACGTSVHELGTRCSAYIRFERPQLIEEDDVIVGEIIYIDHFGNCITNIPVRYSIGKMVASGREIAVGARYDEAGQGELICLPGSIGHYEIAGYMGKASKVLGAQIGTAVKAVKHRPSLDS